MLVGGSVVRRRPLANWLRRPRMHADCHLNWGWGKATARLYRSDEILCLSTMGYKKFLSGAQWPESASPTGLSMGDKLGRYILPWKSVDAYDCVQRTQTVVRFGVFEADLARHVSQHHGNLGCSATRSYREGGGNFRMQEPPKLNPANALMLNTLAYILYTPRPEVFKEVEAARA
jgi:hypothetical protein